VSAQHWLCCCGGGGEPTECCRCEGDAEYPSSISFSWTGQVVIEQMDCADLDCTPIQQYHIGVKDPVTFSIGTITIPFDETGCAYIWCDLIEFDVERWYFPISPSFGCSFWTLDTTAYTYETAKVVQVRPPNICASRDYWEVNIYLAGMRLVFHSEGGYHCLPKTMFLQSVLYGECPIGTLRDEYINLAANPLATPPLCDPAGISPVPTPLQGALLNKLKSALTGTVTIS
jgi:hypothetical protein